MQRSTLLLVSAALLSSAATAQFTHVLPNGNATTEGNTSNAFPWGRGSSASLQIQTIYDSSNFTAASITSPIVISRLRYRLNGNASNATTASYTSATVTMATATLDALTPSTTFATNMGPDQTLVYSGPVQVNPVTASSPGAFGFVDITLTTPFLYDPTAGDFVIFSDIPPGVGTGVPSLQLDVQSTGSLSSRVYNSTAYGSGTGTITTNHGVVVEITYAPAVGFASKRTFGAGCLSQAGSAFEEFATSPAFDLANSSMSLLPGPGGYVALPGVSPYMAPSGSATALTLTDDSQTAVTLGSSFPYPTGATTSLTVCSNGFVSVATGNGTAFSPSASAFLAFPQTCWACWHDYNPAAAGSGAVKFEEVGNLSIVTWDGVYDFGTTTPNTFQLQFDRSTGAVHYVWQAMSGGGTTGHLVGFKCGGAALTTSSIDISALLPGSFTLGCDTRPLALDADARPVIGTNINVVTTNVPATAVATISRLTFGAVVPPLSLTPLGADGCFAHVTVTGPDNLFLFGTPSVSRPLSIPANPALAGIRVVGQSASLVPGVNPLGIITSNGLELNVDVN